jgi:YVTN family beta-propeller protein
MQRHNSWPRIVILAVVVTALAAPLPLIGSSSLAEPISSHAPDSAHEIQSVANMAVTPSGRALGVETWISTHQSSENPDAGSNRWIGTIPVESEPAVPAFDFQNGNVYVTNVGENSVSVISGSNNSVVTTIRVAGGPSAPLYDSSNDDLYVANSLADTVSVISTSTEAVVKTIAVGQCPDTPALDTSTGDVYVPDGCVGATNPENISIIAGSNNTVVDTVAVGADPYPPAFDSSNGDLYVPNFGTSNLTVISGNNHTVVSNIVVGSEPSTPLVDPTNGDIYVACSGSGEIRVISGTNNTIVATLSASIGVFPATPAFDVSTGNIYVPGQGDVYVISGTSNTLLTIVTLSPGSPTYDPANGDLYVPGLLSGTVGVISGASNTVVATFTVGKNPLTPTYDSMNEELYVPNSGYNNVSVLPGQVPYQLFVADFTESGLPTGTNWVVHLDGTPYGGTVASILITGVPNGTHPFLISPLPGFSLNLPSGSLFISNANVSVPVTYTIVPPPSYSVTFTEQGLIADSKWSATLNGTTRNATSAAIVFNETNGTYAFKIGSVPGYTVAPTSGNIVVIGAPKMEAITFHTIPPPAYLVTFTETGLPAATSWSISINGTSNESATAAIQVNLPNGSYQYAVGTVSGYAAHPTGGPLAIDGLPAVVSISFSKNSTGSSSSGPGLLGLPNSTGEYILIGVGAVIVVAAVAVLLRNRSKKSRSKVQPNPPVKP